MPILEGGEIKAKNWDERGDGRGDVCPAVKGEEEEGENFRKGCWKLERRKSPCSTVVVVTRLKRVGFLGGGIFSCCDAINNCRQKTSYDVVPIHAGSRHNNKESGIFAPIVDVVRNYSRIKGGFQIYYTLSHRI